MLLETIKSLVKRSKKRKDLTVDIQPLPSLVRRAETTTTQTTLVDDVHNNAHPSNGPGPNVIPTNAVSTLPTTNFFPHAQNSVFNNPTMIVNTIDSSGTLLQLLAQKRIPGAEVDSSARDPPPKCHPDTRKSLRGRVIHWVNDPDRHWRMLWTMGPMGVGKSAVAQTIAEELKASGRLGASLFFSRPNHRDDPDGVVPTLVYQLAVQCPEYKRIITQHLADDVTILEKNRRTQFKELIIEPFQILMTQQPQIVREPLVIILDGLDECSSQEAQCEFVELISNHTQQVDEFPLLWMICSRPEWHLKALVSHPDFHIACQHEEIFVDDAEAQRDVSRVLKAGFQDIRRKYYDRLDPDWPSDAYIRCISATASGHFAFASTIIKFVGDQYRVDPQGQLDICIRFLGGSGSPGAVNPLHALDLLYRQVLSGVPHDILPTTMRVLGLFILYPDTLLTACVHANFLSLSQSAFYRSLHQLHSVLDIPTPAAAYRGRLHFYHASFADYLCDSLRSGPFAINKPAVHHDVAIQSLKWQSYGTGHAEANSETYFEPRPRLEWVPSGVTISDIVLRLKDYSSNVGWRACCHVSDEDVPRVVAELEHFDFNDMKEEPPYFAKFLAWLYKLGVRNNSLLGVLSLSDSAIQDNEPLSVVHYNKEGYLSVFGIHDPDVMTTLRLRLGPLNNPRDIELTVFLELSPMSSPTETPTFLRALSINP